MVDIRQRVTKQMWEALEARGKILGVIAGTTSPGFGAETLIDSLTFTHTQGYYEEARFTSRFSLNATGVAIIRFRYVAGVGPVTTAGTLVYETIAGGSGSNNNMSTEKVLPAAFRSLASGTYTLGVFAQAAAGAASGTINGSASGIERDFVIKSFGSAT